MEFSQQLNFSGTPKKRRQVNLTPLIDMMFLLVIFFMLTTSFGITNLLEMKAAEDKSKPVDPVIEVSGGNAAEQKMIIRIMAAKKISVDGKEMTEDEFDSMLFKRLKKNSLTHITIETGDSVPVQKLIALLDRVNTFGSADITLSEAVQ